MGNYDYEKIGKDVGDKVEDIKEGIGRADKFLKRYRWHIAIGAFVAITTLMFFLS